MQENKTGLAAVANLGHIEENQCQSAVASLCQAAN